MRRDPVERRPAARARTCGRGGRAAVRAISLSPPAVSRLYSVRKKEESTLCDSLRERDHTRAETREEKAVLLTRLHVLEQPFA